MCRGCGARFATGLSFALFGIGGLCLRVLVFPLLALLPGDAITRRSRARQTVSRLFWLFVQFMYRSGVLTYEVEGAERLGRPGQLIIANHPSLIDVVVLIALIRDANCVVKQSLWDNPSPVGRSAPRSTSATTAAPDARRSGRSPAAGPDADHLSRGHPHHARPAPAVPSRSGGHRAARRAAGDAGGDQRDTDYPDQGRTTVPHPSRRFHFHLRVGDDIDPQAFAATGAAPIASRRLNDHLHRHFIKELALDEPTDA